MHHFSMSCGFNRLRNCIRDTLEYLEKYFHTGKVDWKCGNFDSSWKPSFSAKLPDIGEVLKIMKNNHGVKISSPDRRKIYLTKRVILHWRKLYIFNFWMWNNLFYQMTSEICAVRALVHIWYPVIHAFFIKKTRFIRNY